MMALIKLRKFVNFPPEFWLQINLVNELKIKKLNRNQRIRLKIKKEEK